MISLNSNHFKVIFFTFLVLGAWYFLCLPKELFNEPSSLILKSRENKLLGARIAADEQWRFPYDTETPQKFQVCITTFEDKRFWNHIGVDLLAIGRAIKLNLTKKSIVSGASTLTMQTIRLARKKKNRSYLEKIIEIILATRLELSVSKKQILSYYASYAPFGGNVVGLQAAAWKYYARSPKDLTWSEMATLAVFPNAPGLIHPNKNRSQLRKKRDFLLKKLVDQKQISSETYKLALLEPLPKKTQRLPNITPHLTDYFLTQTKNLSTKKQLKSTINFDLQKQANRLLKNYANHLKQNDINNAAVLILDVNTNEVLVYCGNTPKLKNSRQNDVDMIRANRSTGSILKPFLYSFALEDGTILPHSLLKDIPTSYAGFAPKNYNRTYQGVVKASEALSRSLNVPIVKLLQNYGYHRFYDNMKQIGMTTLDKEAQHYGLSIILGGAETSLWDISTMYTGLIRSVKDYNKNYFYRSNCFDKAKILLDSNKTDSFTQKENIISASSAYFTLEAMKEVKRPGVLASWKSFSSSRKIAWKTGTSFGNRDAWAIGCTKDYVVAVWVGNADGEGRPAMTGTQTAAPLLFKAFNLLPKADTWLEKPTSNMETNTICANSGYLASNQCKKTKKSFCGLQSRNSTVCGYCMQINVNKAETYRVTSDCYSPLDMKQKKVFLLPPTEEYYFAKVHPSYKKSPSWLSSCLGNTNSKAMSFVYPQLNSNIYVPINLSGEKGKTVFEVKHRNPSKLIYWYLDAKFIGSTIDIHEVELDPKPGKHTIVLVDEMGERLARKFEVVNKL